MTVDMDMDIDMGVDMGVICPCTSYAMAPPHSTARRRSRAQPEGGEVRRGVDAARLVRLEIGSGSVVSVQGQGQWSVGRVSGQGQWSGSGHWLVVSGQGQWSGSGSVVSGQWSVVRARARVRVRCSAITVSSGS